MIYLYPSLCHHPLQIPAAQEVAAIPEDIEEDNLCQKVPYLHKVEVDIGT
jgi:hypothetical protein